MLTAEDVAEKVTRVVTLPDVYWRIQELIRRADSTLTEFATVIQTEPTLTAKVLGLANSAFFGFPGKVDTVTRAVNILGMAQLHDLALAISVIRAFSGIPAAQISLQDFWRRSIFCGLTAKNLAATCKVLDTERFFLEALLHDIGHLAMYLAVPEAAARCLQRALDDAEPVHVAERRELGFDYGQVGASLLRQWRLPLNFLEIAECHIRPERAEEFRPECCLVHLAWHGMLKHEHGKERPGLVPEAQPLAWESSGLKGSDLEDALTQAAEELTAVASLLLPSPVRGR